MGGDLFSLILNRIKNEATPQNQLKTNLPLKNFARKVEKFVRKYYTYWLNDLADKFYDRKKIIDFILCHALLKIVLFC